MKKLHLTVGFVKDANEPDILYCGSDADKARTAFTDARASGDYLHVQFYRNPNPRSRWTSGEGAVFTPVEALAEPPPAPARKPRGPNNPKAQVEPEKEDSDLIGDLTEG